jgi:hypothetical protein
MKNIQVPISIGEAIDRLTILKIKLNQIKNDDKLKNVRTDHDLLEKAIYKYYPEAPIFPLNVDSHIFGELFKVNKELWDVEDKLRVLERGKDFGSEFVELARSVYYLNDNRANVKKRINIEYKSELIEEKSYEAY